VTVADIVLASVPGVELMRTGRFAISTGTFDFIPDDLRAAVASQDCPAVRNPVLKLGHVDPRFDGEPAVGYVANLRLEGDGVKLVGDFQGMPGWLGNGVLASAYPDRSIEGRYDFVCQKGHTHPFVIEAVAFLGVTAPGIGTLESLQDVQALYAGAPVAAAVGNGVPVSLHTSSPGEGVVSVDAAKVSVSAAVSAEDVRRAFNAKLDAADDWDRYIEEVQLDPPQLIVVNDRDGSRTRVPLAIGADDTIEFGEPVTVRIQYADVAVAASSSRPQSVTFTRDEARTGRVAKAAPTADPANVVVPQPITDAGHEAGEPTQEGSAMADSLRDALVAKLGLPADVTDEALNEAVEGMNLAPAADEENPAPAALPEGTVAVDQTRMDALVAAAATVEAFKEERRVERRDSIVSAAVKDGKIPPARRAHYESLYDRDPEGTAEFLQNTPAGLVPYAAAGYAGTAEPITDEDKALDAELVSILGGK